jgi:glyoxylase-like metal-dependent hydrolase (beta-lactamase superfamily II)
MPSIPIHPIDLHFQGSPEAIAAYLVIGPEGPVLVETGPGSSLPALQDGLAQHGVRPADIRDVLVTHIHLDHAGAAGWWARQGARIHVHQVGAPHLIDPERLLASARRIYGDAMDSLWGEFLASPAEKVHGLRDGDVVEAGGLHFTAFDTPGHARHHMLYRLEDVAFTGDLAGIRLGGRPYLRLPTPPPEFDLPAWLASLDRARAEKFSRLYLTHFGVVDDVEGHWAEVESRLHEYTDFAGRELARGAERDVILAAFEAREAARQAAAGLSLADRERYAAIGPAGMSVDGLLRYWNRSASPAPPSRSDRPA